MIDAETRPRLAGKARLRYDRQSQRYLLLYPERGLELNGTAVDVVRCAPASTRWPASSSELTEKYTDKPREVVEREVLSFLAALADRGLVQGEP